MVQAHMPQSARKMGLKNLLVGVLVIMLALPPQSLAQDVGNDLPDIGSPASSVLSLDDEYRIGLQIVRQLRDEGQVIHAPESTEYLQALAPLAPHLAEELWRGLGEPPFVFQRALPAWG